MKKIISIIVLFSYLSSYTEFREFLKLPLLVQHFSEHNSRDHSLSFSEFLCMHYLHTQDSDGDDAQDKNLPFKSHSNCSLNYASNFYPQDNIIEIKSIETVIVKLNINSEKFVYSSFPSTIWQPPKI